jgi:NADH-quinone oxidoreductase subunit G
LAPALDAAPSATFRMTGAKVPRSPHRASGRTAVLANINVSEPKPPDDPDSPLAFSMEGTSDHPPGSLIPFVWAPGWNSIQATHTYQQEVGGPLRGGDPGVRMFEPTPSNDRSYFSGIPSAFESFGPGHCRTRHDPARGCECR